MSDISNTTAKVIASYNYASQTVRMTRGNKTRIYFMDRRMSVSSFIRLWKLAWHFVPRHMLINESDGFMFFWYQADIPLDWTHITKDSRKFKDGYWDIYSSINRAMEQRTKTNSILAYKLALLAYGWSEKDYNDAWLTAMEIRSNTQ